MNIILHANDSREPDIDAGHESKLINLKYCNGNCANKSYPTRSSIYTSKEEEILVV